MLVRRIYVVDGTRSDTYGTVVEPPKDKVVVPLDGYGVRFRSAVGFEVVPAVLERDASSAFELFVVPLGHLGVREKCVVAACEAGLSALSHIVV